MPANIDELQIEINANAAKANQSIDRLVTKLNGLSASLSKLNTSSLTGLANGVNRLGSAMQTMNAVKTSDFTRLANNVQRLGSINVQSLNSAASSMSHLTRAFNNLGSVSANAMQVGELARNISRLGNASVQRAITNIPQLATSLNQLMATLSRAPRVSSNVIQMTQALANLANQGSRVGSASRSIVTGLANTRTAMTRTTKSTFSLAAAFGRFYANYFLVIRGIKRFVSAITGTSDYIEAFNYYTVAMGKIASKWDKDWETYGDELGKTFSNKFIETTNETFSKLSGVKLDLSVDFKTGILSETGMKNLGLNIKEVTQYAAQLASMMDSVGQSGETTLATTNAMVKLAGDISSLYNINYSDAAKNIQSVLMGQSRAGYKFGWDTTMASLQSVADKFNLSKPVSEMAQFEKQQLRILTILEQSKVAYGDLANTIDSPSNMIRQFKNNLSEAGMVLGQLFVPMLQKVLPVLNGITIAIKRLLGSIAEFFGISLDLSQFGQGYTEMEDGMDGLSDSLDSVTESAKKAKAGLRGFDELKTISVPSASSGSGGAGGGTIDLTDEILKATEEYNKVWQEAYDKMENRAEKFAKKVEKALKPIKKLFKDLAIGDYFAVGEDVSTIVSGINNFFARAIEKVNWSKVGRNIGKFLAGINWLEVIKSGFRLKFDIAKAIAEVWFGGFRSAPFETAIITGLAIMRFTGLDKMLALKLAPKIKAALIKATSIGGLGTSLLGNIGTLLTTDLGYIMGHGSFAAIGSTVFLGVTGAIAAAFVGWNFGQWLYEKISGEDISMSFTEQMKTIADAFKDGTIKDAVGLWWKDIKQGFVDGWNFIVDWWNSSAIGKWWNDNVAPWFNSGTWKQLFHYVSKDFKEGWKSVVDWWNSSALVKWWNQNILPWFSGGTWLELFTYVKQDFISGWNSIKEWWSNSALSKWWEEDVSPWFTKEKWTSLLGNIKTSFEEKWNEVETWWDNTALGNWWNSKVMPWFTKEKWLGALSGIKDAFTETWEAAMSGIKGIWNKFANFLNEKLTFEIEPISIAGKQVFDGAKINLGKIPTFATGGFPEDGLFMANRDELVGKFSNGRTAVANNDQITKGIADAVYPAVYNAVVSAMSNSSSNQNVNVTLQGDVSKIFRAVQDESRSYTRRTGKPAFN